MKATFPGFRALLLSVLALSASGAHLAATARFHFALDKSVPADQAAVHHVSEVRLWFTEPPSGGTVSIRLIDGAGDAVPTADPAQEAEERTAFSIALPDGVAAGAYSVAWRGMGDDGHVVRGEFTFTDAGLFASWVHLDGVGALVTSAYGRLLLLKLALVAGVLALGALNSKRLTPTLGAPAGRSAMRRSATLGFALANLLLAVTAVLVRASPM